MRTVPLAFVVALGACPASPEFVARDVDVDVDAGGDAGGDAGCGGGCGPGLACDAGACLCARVGCEETIIATGVVRVVMARRGAAVPHVGFVRAGDPPMAAVATWEACCGWGASEDITPVADVLSLAIASDGRPLLLGSGAEGLAVVWRGRSDGRFARIDTGVAPCHLGALASADISGEVVMGCVDEDGTLDFWTWDSFGEGFVGRAGAPLELAQAPVAGRVRWLLDDAGRARVVYAQPGLPSGSQLVLAEAGEAGWDVAPFDLVAPDGVAELDLALAATFDGDGGLHVVAASNDVGAARVVTHHWREGDVWHDAELLRGDAAGLARRVLAAAPGLGAHIQVLVDDGVALVWLDVADDGASPARATRGDEATAIVDAAIVTDAGQAMVALVDAAGALVFWRPSDAAPAP